VVVVRNPATVAALGVSLRPRRNRSARCDVCDALANPNGQLAFGDDNYFARTFRFTFVSLGFALLCPGLPNGSWPAKT
jgi:hypothetical protein